jgi:hypothetical protein
MRTTRTITATLAAVLAAASLAGPAAAIPADVAHHQTDTSYAGKSTIQGSLPSNSSHDPATANAYVPPAALGPDRPSTPDATPPTKPRPSAVADAPASGFDWGSAGIGAAAGIGASAIALAGTAGMRRRRLARPRSVATH